MIRSNLLSELVNLDGHGSCEGIRTPPGHPLRLKNVIFGHNGYGKSTLARALHAHGRGLATDDTVVLFGRSYVEEEFATTATEFPGVTLSFGKAQVDQRTHITELEAQLVSLRANTGTCTDKVRKLDSDGKDRIAELVKRYKGNLRINAKPAAKTLLEVVDLWVADCQAAEKQFGPEEIKSASAGEDHEAELARLQRLSLPQIPSLDSDDLVDIDAIMSVSYPTDLLSPTLAKWLSDGLALHTGKSACEFCGHSIDLGELSEKIVDSINSGAVSERQRLIDFLEIISQSQDSLIHFGSLVAAEAFTAVSASAAAFDAVEFSRQIADGFKAPLEKLQSKIDDMSSVGNVSWGDVEECISLARVVATQVDSEINSRRGSLQKKINRLNEVVRGRIGYEVRRDDALRRVLSDVTDARKELAALEDECEKVLRELTKLKEAQSDVGPFADYLNHTLEHLGLDFKIRPDNKNYQLVSKSGRFQPTVASLSEGERNLLALLYFCYSLKNDVGSGFRENLRLVIIDDPACSLDDRNRFFILQLIGELLDLNTRFQCIVLTHSWQDFCHYSYFWKSELQGKGDDSRVAVFHLKKQDERTSLVGGSLKVMDSPFHTMLREIIQFADVASDEVQPTDVIHMPNTMRRVLEEYLAFNAGISGATENNTEKILRHFHGEKISGGQKSRMKDVLTVCNVFSHQVPRSFSGEEVHKVARTLVRLIGDKNKHLVDNLRQAVR